MNRCKGDTWKLGILIALVVSQFASYLLREQLVQTYKLREEELESNWRNITTRLQLEVEEQAKIVKRLTSARKFYYPSSTWMQRTLEDSLATFVDPSLFHIIYLVKSRPSIFEKSFDALLNATNIDNAHITIFQHGQKQEMQEVIEKLKTNSDLSFETEVTAMPNLVSQYGYALRTAFQKYPDVQYVIVMEEDLVVSPDFFTYFQQLAPILESDNSLCAAIGWNDNGFWAFSRDPAAVFRSEVFVGLGWMIHRKWWNEVEPLWPTHNTVWDVWFESLCRNRSRDVLYPEIPRVYHYNPPNGVGGVTTQYSRQLVQYENMRMFTKPIVDLLNPQRLLNSSYDGAVVGKWLNEGILIRSIEEITQYEGETLLIYLNAAGWDDRAWASSVDPLELLLAYRFWRLRNYYKGTTHFNYGGNLIVIIGTESPFAKPFKERNIQPISHQDMAAPIDWSKAVWPQGVNARIGKKGQSCDEVCEEHNEYCDVHHMHLVDNCAYLHTIFECPKVCTHIGVHFGKDINATDWENPSLTNGRCVTAAFRHLRCSGKNPKSTRVCTCSAEDEFAIFD